MIALFRDELMYNYLGVWSDRSNSNIEEALLASCHTRRGYGTARWTKCTPRRPTRTAPEYRN